MSLETEAFLPLVKGDHRYSKSIQQFILDFSVTCYSTSGKPENLFVECFPKKTLSKCYNA